MPLCQAEHVSVLPFYALAAGFLTGKYRSDADLSKSPRGAKVKSAYLNPRGARILAALDQVASALYSPTSRASTVTSSRTR
jgi:aryl-alcohol dehydrogenase-like predicted oxidoreductase